MLDYFKVEFYTGRKGKGPFVHVVANDVNVAVVLAQAERIAQGNDDLRIEHVWTTPSPETFAKTAVYRLAGKSRVIPDPDTLEMLVS